MTSPRYRNAGSFNGDAADFAAHREQTQERDQREDETGESLSLHLPKRNREVEDLGLARRLWPLDAGLGVQKAAREGCNWRLVHELPTARRED